MKKENDVVGRQVLHKRVNEQKLKFREIASISNIIYLMSLGKHKTIWKLVIWKTD